MIAGMFGLVVIGVILLLAYLEEKWEAERMRRSRTGGAYHRASPSPPERPIILPYRNAEGSGYEDIEMRDKD